MTMMLSDRVMDEYSHSDCSSGVRSALRSAHSPQSPQGLDFSARQRHVQLRTDEQGDITAGSCPRQLARQSVRLESLAQLTNQPHEWEQQFDGHSGVVSVTFVLWTLKSCSITRTDGVACYSSLNKGQALPPPTHSPPCFEKLTG
ncbi:hypothetical protein MHYP_G00006830 [Metynnis hypsauchen]